MTTPDIEAIEKRWTDSDPYSLQLMPTRARLEDVDDLITEVRALRAALTAETARADGLAHEKPQWIAHLADAQDRVDALQSQLTVANEKLASAREAIGNLRDALRGFARIEVPADAPNSQWVAKTLHCNDQVTAGQVLRARTVLLETTLSEAATSPTTPASQEGQRAPDGWKIYRTDLGICIQHSDGSAAGILNDEDSARFTVLRRFLEAFNAKESQS